MLGSLRRVATRALARRFVGISGASVLVAMLDAVGLLLLVPLVDVLSSGESGATSDVPVLGDLGVGPLLGLVVGFFLAKSLASAAIRWWASGVVARASAETATALFDVYMRAPIEFHDTKNTSSIVNVVQSTVRQVFDRGFMATANIVSEGSTLAVLAIVVFVASPGPALGGVAYFASASWIFMRILQRSTRARAAEGEAAGAAAVRAVQEGLGGLREHRVRGSEPHLVSVYGRERAKVAGSDRVVMFGAELSRYYLEVLFIGGFGVITAIALSSGSADDALTGLALLLGAGFRVLPSIARLLSSTTSLRAGRVSLDVILDDLDDLGVTKLFLGRASKPIEGETSRSTAVDIAFENVTFAYPGGAAALENVSFMVPAGTSLGVVGPSGAGKSTLVDLVCGVRVPGSGRVLAGGETVVVGTSRAVGLVPQDVFLLDDTVAANVAFGLPHDEDLVRDALSRAQLLAFVDSLPDGTGTTVGERGTRLSGGQRQRLGIARALYRSPGILVLDEATAALDVETEAAVVESVEALSGSLTVVVIAHRLSTIARCDQIAYLDGGRLLAVGTLDEVAHRVPAFARALELARMSGGQGLGG